MQTLTPDATAAALPYAELIDEIRSVLADARAGAVRWMPRSGITTASGTQVLAMLAADATLAISKTVTVQATGGGGRVPTVNGTVTLLAARDGTPLLALDAPTLTARRTAAVTAVAARWLGADTTSAFVIGSGTLARAHVACLAEVAGLRRLHVLGRDPAKARALAAALDRTPGLRAEAADGIDAAFDACGFVLTATSSRLPVLNRAGRAGQVIAAVGAYRPTMAELDPALVRGAFTIVVDDLQAARHEAGDLIQAEVDWRRVLPLASLLDGPAPAGAGGYRIFKSVGHSLWDLAAARVAWRHAAAGERRRGCSRA